MRRGSGDFWYDMAICRNFYFYLEILLYMVYIKADILGMMHCGPMVAPQPLK
jgi:hypothetical protein